MERTFLWEGAWLRWSQFMNPERSPARGRGARRSLGNDRTQAVSIQALPVPGDSSHHCQGRQHKGCSDRKSEVTQDRARAGLSARKVPSQKSGFTAWLPLSPFSTGQLLRVANADLLNIRHCTSSPPNRRYLAMYVFSAFTTSYRSSFPP